MNRDPNGLGWALVFGIMLFAIGVSHIITGTGGQVAGIYGTIPVVDWIGWVELPIGIVICIMSIRALLRGPKKYTDEEVARAKEELDRMLYFEEHSSLPHQPGSPLEETNHKKDA